MRNTARLAAWIVGLMLLPQALGHAAELAEPKGIALTVTLARKVIQPGEDLAFTVTLKNVSGALPDGAVQAMLRS